MMSEATSIVFVVDDDDAVRRALTRLIRSAGYCVESFGSAHEFLECRPYSQGCACLVLDGDIAMTVRAMKAGATDFLAKPVSDSDLMRAIADALRVSSRALSSRVELDCIHGRMARLTPREREVLTLLVEGRLNKQVVCELGIAEKTIKVHRARVMEKMEARSLVDLVRATAKACIPLSPLPSAFP
jgi:FixJ family two-component response regulator